MGVLEWGKALVVEGCLDRVEGSWGGNRRMGREGFVLGKETSVKVLRTCVIEEIYNRQLKDIHGSVRREAYILRKGAKFVVIDRVEGGKWLYNR